MCKVRYVLLDVVMISLENEGPNIFVQLWFIALAVLVSPSGPEPEIV